MLFTRFRRRLIAMAATDARDHAPRGIRPANAGLESRRQKCPVLRQKRVDLIRRRRVEACQHVRQVRKRIDCVGDARGDDGVEGSQVLARVLVPSEQEILATEDKS